MNSDSDREIAIFTEALKVAMQDRDAFLNFACGTDAELRAKVDGLLKAHERLGSFLEEPPHGFAEDLDDFYE